MQRVRDDLKSRMREIIAYLGMLRFVEGAGGTVSLSGRTGAPSYPIDQSTVHVLKAGVFLHLYNLVESTVTAAIGRIAEEIKATGVRFRDLNDQWRRAWAKSVGKIDLDLTVDNRLDAVLRLCQAVVDGIALDIEPKFGSGNLDDQRIERVANQFGVKLAIRPNVQRAVKQRILNDHGFLGLIKTRRNDLAHGTDSFAEIGKDYTILELRKWSMGTYQYLLDVLTSFEACITKRHYHRPGPAAGPVPVPGVP